MRTNFLLLLLFSVVCFSCNTLYRSGQTPDDLYAAKGKVITDEDNHDKTDSRANDDYSIRLGVNDPRWRELDDYDYSPYDYGYNYGYYYNPCYYPYPVYAPWAVYVNPKNTAIRKTNLEAYTHEINVYTPTKTGGTVRTVITRGYNVGNINTTRNTDYNSTRTYNPGNNSNDNSNRGSSGNNSSNNNSGSSSGGSISRPSRGN